jgi:hypothetical protein
VSDIKVCTIPTQLLVPAEKILKGDTVALGKVHAGGIRGYNYYRIPVWFIEGANSVSAVSIWRRYWSGGLILFLLVRCRCREMLT